MGDSTTKCYTSLEKIIQARGLKCLEKKQFRAKVISAAILGLAVSHN